MVLRWIFQAIPSCKCLRTCGKMTIFPSGTYGPGPRSTSRRWPDHVDMWKWSGLLQDLVATVHQYYLQIYRQENSHVLYAWKIYTYAYICYLYINTYIYAYLHILHVYIHPESQHELRSTLWYFAQALHPNTVTYAKLLSFEKKLWYSQNAPMGVSRVMGVPQKTLDGFCERENTLEMDDNVRGTSHGNLHLSSDVEIDLKSIRMLWIFQKSQAVDAWHHALTSNVRTVRSFFFQTAAGFRLEIWWNLGVSTAWGFPILKPRWWRVLERNGEQFSFGTTGGSSCGVLVTGGITGDLDGQFETCPVCECMAGTSLPVAHGVSWAFKGGSNKLIGISWCWDTTSQQQSTCEIDL